MYRGFLSTSLACSVASLVLSVFGTPRLASAQSELPQSSPPDPEPAPTPSESPPAPSAAAPDSAPATTTDRSATPTPTPPAEPPPVEPPPDESSSPRIIAFGSNTRLSAGLPGGDVYKGLPLGDLAGVMFQLEGTLDAVLLERLVLGLRIGVGIATLDESLSRACKADNAGSCHLTTVNFGVHGEFLIFPRRARLNPWVGLGLTHEVLMLEETVGSRSYGGHFSGRAWDFTAGLDFRPGKGPSFGPFATYRTGKYTTVNADDVNGIPQSAPIANPSGHHWFMLGVRSRF
jgi:hypothetical protein